MIDKIIIKDTTDESIKILIEEIYGEVQ